MLTTFWVPMVNFSVLKDKLKSETDFKDSLSKQIDTISFKKDNYSIIIDSIGFYYIQSKNQSENSFNNLLKDIITKKSKDLLESSFLNTKLACKVEEYSIVDFINHIKVEIDQIDDIDLKYINYNIQDNPIKSFKFTNSNKKLKSIEEHISKQIIERDFEGLLKKSILYTHDYFFDKNEVYNLEILDTIDYLAIIRKIDFKFNNLKNKKNKINNKIIENVIKKAIQDTIEEITLLQFLKKSKKKYIINIYDKITKANELISKIQSQMLAIDTQNEDREKDRNCKIDNEEDIEDFIECLLQSLPKFRVIDDKLKNSYYIKIGNITTNNVVSKNETIQNILAYQKWLSSIKYFESMSYQLKEVIAIYHQNKNIKALENISYYENYKSDLEDIKNIQFNEDEKYGLNSQQKSTIERYVLIIATFALAGEAPIINSQHILLWVGNNLQSFGELLKASGVNFLTTILNVILYFIFFQLLFKTFRNQTSKIYKSVIKFLSIKKDEKKNYFFKFDPSDYDKHEHRSTKLLTTYNLYKNESEPLMISYDERSSAYNLMKNLKKVQIHKRIDKCFNYPLFPAILTKAITQNSNIRENYRISRTDKVTTKILLRYKITEITLFDFLDFISEDEDFINYYNKIKEENFIQNTINEIKNKCKEEYKSSLKCNEFLKNDEEANNGIYLNLYIVYSFNLKLQNSDKKPEYTYQVQKDQFRVHYHINKLPKNNIDDTLTKIAELIYIYFLARLKNFDYLSNKTT